MSSVTNDPNNNRNRPKHTDQQKITPIVKEIPFFNASSRSIEYLQKKHLHSSCFNNEIEFKQFIAHLTLTICEHPHNASLILNLSIPLPMYRSIMMEKFRKLDHILSIVIKPLDITHRVLTTRYKNCNYKDVVAHYTRYQYVMNDHINNDDNNNNNNNIVDDDDDLMIDNNDDNNTDDDKSIAGYYVRSNILGQNSNFDQFLLAIRSHLCSDHNQFLTISAPLLTNSDVNLLCSRYYIICESLITFKFGDEIICDESRYYRDILQYLNKFIKYMRNIHYNGLNDDFNGLTSDQLKLLISGTVLLEFGLRKEREIIRLVLNINKESNKYLDIKLRHLDLNTINKTYFKLNKKIVDYTPGSKNHHFRKDIEKYLNPIYQTLKHFLMTKK